MSVTVLVTKNPYKWDDLFRVQVEPGQSIQQIIGVDHTVHAWIDGHACSPLFVHHAQLKDNQTVFATVVPDDPGTLAAIGSAIATAASASAAAASAASAAIGGWGVVAQVGISIGLSVASSLVASTPASNRGSAAGGFDRLNSITGSQNTIAKYQVMPRLLGRMRYFPPIPMTATPYTEVTDGGETQYLRMYFLLNAGGPIEIGGHKVGPGYSKITQDDALDNALGQPPIRIGETDINEYDELEYEIGTPDQMTLYKDQIVESSPNWTTESDASGRESDENATITDGDVTTRTTEEDAEEITLDLTGQLYTVDSNGDFSKLRVTFKIEWRLSGSDDAWQSDTLVISDNNGKTSRKTYRITGIEKGRYDVRLTRVRTYFSNLEGAPSSSVTWNALRTIRKRNAFAVPDTTVMSLRVKATDQLDGRIKKLNVLATSVLDVWDGEQWSKQATRAHAWAFNTVWTDSANREPLNQSAINESALLAWARETEAAGRYYDNVLDNAQITQNRIQEIATAGRAAWNIESDTRISVIREVRQDDPAVVVSPRLYSNYSYTLSVFDPPHALRVRYIDADSWEQTDRVVYDDGYGKNDDPDRGIKGATKYETIDAPGCTDPRQAWKHGRYELARRRLLNTAGHQFVQDVQHYTYNRGDRIDLANDTLQFGLGSARVKSVEKNSDGNIVAFTVDRYFLMDKTDVDYGVTVSAPVGREVSVLTNYVETAVPGTSRFDLKSPVKPVSNMGGTVTRDGIKPGDHIAFGEAGRITTPIKVATVRGKGNNKAQIICEPYDPRVIEAERGDIPEPDINITIPPDPATSAPSQPTILSVISDRSVALENDDGSLTWRVAVEVQANAGRVSTDHIDVQMRAEDALTYDTQTAVDGVAYFTGYRPGQSVVIRIRAISEDGEPSAWVPYGTYTVEGRIPQPPEGLRVTPQTLSADLDPIGGKPGSKYVFLLSGTPLDPDDVKNNATRLNDQPASTWTITGRLDPDTVYYAHAYAVTIYGESSVVSQRFRTRNDASALLKAVNERLSKSALTQELQKEIERIQDPAQITDEIDRSVLAEAEEREKAIQNEAEKLSQSIQDEAAAQAEALLNQRNELDSVIEQNQTINQSRDESLANSIATVAAGSGEQFDSSVIWYYDDQLDGWSGGHLDTGYLVPDSDAPALTSPAGIGIDGNSRRYVKARIKKSDDAVWIGRLEWRVAGDDAWHGPATIDEPPVDADGVTTVAWQDISWSGEIDQIRVQLSDSDAYTLDWLAIGRPTPGASTASVQREAEARMTADSAEARARETFAAQMRGDYEGDDPAQLSRGLLYEERRNRIAENSALSEQTEALKSAINHPESGLDANAGAIEETRTQVERNDQRIRSESERTSQLSSEIQSDRAINLIMRPGQAPSPATRDVINSQATERVRAVTEQQGDTLTNYAERLNSLDSSYESQQEEIATKASQSELARVESDAEGARGTLRDSIEAGYTGAINTAKGELSDEIEAVQRDVDTKATNNRVNTVESDAEKARSTLQESLTASFNSKIDSKADIERVNQAESNAEKARGELKTTIETGYTNAVDEAKGDLQGQIDSKASNTRLDRSISDAEEARSTLSENLSTSFSQEVESAKQTALDAASDAQIAADKAGNNLEINPNPGEFYLYGSTNGQPDRDADFVLRWDGSEQRVVRQQLTGGWTGMTGASPRSKGFIAVETRSDRSFGVRDRQSKVAFVRKSGGQWQFDDNSDWQSFDVNKDIVAVGWMDAGGDMIYQAGLFGAPVSLDLASFPSADVTGENTAANTAAVGDRSAGDVNNELDSVQTQVNTKASIDRVNDVESNAEEARGQLQTTIQTSFTQSLSNMRSDLETQINSKASAQRVANVESNAETARGELKTTLESEFDNQFAQVQETLRTKADSETVEAMYTLRVSGQTADGQDVYAAIGAGVEGDSSRIVLSADELAFGKVGQSGIDFPFYFDSNAGKALIKEANIGELNFTKLRDSSGNFVVGANGKIDASKIDVGSLEVDYSLVVGGPPSDADRTSENTSSDTRSVDGRSSRLVRQSSQTSLTNDFDGPDGNFWTNEPQSDGTPSYIQSTDFSYSGTYSGMFQSVQTDPHPYRTGGIPRLQIPQAIADRFSGQRIRVSVYALSKAFFDFGLSYSVDNYGYSGWQKFRPSEADTWEKFSFVYDTPETTGSVGTYLNIWGDTSGNNYNTYIGLVTINIVSKDADIDATKTTNGPREANADRTDSNTASDVQTGSGKAVRERGANRTENNTANDVETGSGKAVEERGANKTENRVAKAIAGQGAFATLDKVTRDNIAAYLESAAISRAYLGYASVGTLEVEGGTLTLLLSANKDREYSGSDLPDNGYIQRIGYTVDGNRVKNATAQVTVTARYEARGNSYSELTARLTRDGEVVKEQKIDYQEAGSIGGTLVIVFNDYGLNPGQDVHYGVQYFFDTVGGDEYSRLSDQTISVLGLWNNDA